MGNVSTSSPEDRPHRPASRWETVITNEEIVRRASDAVVQGDALALMAHLSPDVVWTVGAAEPEAAPWFGEYCGKRGVLQFLEDLSAVGPVEITDKAVLADGDLVVTWVHVIFRGPNGRAVEMDEAHFWRLADGRIVAVDLLVDTAAVAAAFT